MNLRAISGIYEISQIGRGRSYVGSANNILKRWATHKSSLNYNQHGNSFLQRTWNKYGESAFAFTVLEFCHPSKLTEREQFWIDKLQTVNPYGFNLQPTARSCLGFKHTKSTKKKMSESAKRRNARPGYNKMLSDRAIAQHAAGKLGQSTWKNPEATLEKIRRRYEDPEFCKRHGARLRKHIAAQSSEEMSRRSKLRRTVGGPWGIFPRRRVRLIEGAK